MVPRIVIHWLQHSRSQRILWLLEELNLPYEIKEYKRDWESFKTDATTEEVYPLKKWPVMELTDPSFSLSTPVILPESGAIITFLITYYSPPSLGPSSLSIPPSSDPLTVAEHSFWMHWAEGTAFQPVSFLILFARLPKNAPWIFRPLVQVIASGAVQGFVLPRMKEVLAFVDERLGEKEFFVAGKLTGVDIMMSMVAEIANAVPGVYTGDYPNLTRWFAAIKDRPAYKKALERGGENDMSLYFK
ncbi:hypothetical protein JCM8547_000206 [Rhodosporidiobolus lusitaniae]